MARFQKFKFPFLIALLLTLTVACVIEKPVESGMLVLLLFYGIFLGIVIYREKGRGKG